MMSAIFGHDGSWGRGKYATFHGSESMSHTGHSTFANDGSMYNAGKISYVNGPRGCGTIQQAGDIFYGPKGTYKRMKYALFGPDGKSWSGTDMTDAEVRDIIFHDSEH